MLIRGNLKAVSIVLVATSLALGGCGKKEDEEEEEETELEGSWKSSCFALDGEEGVYKYSQNVVKVEGAKMMRVDSRHAATDTTCSEAPDFFLEFTSEFKIGNDVTTPAGAKEIDVTHKSVMVTLKGQQTVDEFNSGKVCGFEDWALDTAKDVSGKVCGDDGKTLDAPVFDIFDVEESSLKFGEKDFDHDGTIAAKRPVALSAKEEVFTKQ